MIHRDTFYDEHTGGGYTATGRTQSVVTNDGDTYYNPDTDDKYPTYLKWVIGIATAVFFYFLLTNI